MPPWRALRTPLLAFRNISSTPDRIPAGRRHRYYQTKPIVRRWLPRPVLTVSYLNIRGGSQSNWGVIALFTVWALIVPDGMQGRKYAVRGALAYETVHKNWERVPITLTMPGGRDLRTVLADAPGTSRSRGFRPVGIMSP